MTASQNKKSRNLTIEILGWMDFAARLLGQFILRVTPLFLANLITILVFLYPWKSSPVNGESLWTWLNGIGKFPALTDALIPLSVFYIVAILVHMRECQQRNIKVGQLVFLFWCLSPVVTLFICTGDLIYVSIFSRTGEVLLTSNELNYSIIAVEFAVIAVLALEFYIGINATIYEMRIEQMAGRG